MASALMLVACGGLSTHQSAKVLEPGTKAYTGGFGFGPVKSCNDSGSLGNGCVLTLDPYWGLRFGAEGPTFSETWIQKGELGFKISGVPFLGGTLMGDARVQALEGPIYQTYDFTLHIFPCISTSESDDEDSEESCGDNPFGGGVFIGTTIGTDWISVGAKYGIGGTTWDGLQLLPGVFANLVVGPKRFKLLPSVDVYFYQWPLDTKPSLRILGGLGVQGLL